MIQLTLGMEGNRGALWGGEVTTVSGTSDEVLTVREVAAYLKVAPKTVYLLIRGGSLAAFRIGRAVRCRRADVETFIERRETLRDRLGRHGEAAHE